MVACCIREAIESTKHDTVPQDIGYNTSDIWRPILKWQSNEYFIALDS